MKEKNRIIILFCVVFLSFININTSAQQKLPVQQKLTLAMVLTGLYTQGNTLTTNTLAKRNSYIIKRVRQLGITFNLTSEIEKELRNAGATNRLIETIRGKSLSDSKPVEKTTTNVTKANKPKTYKNSTGIEFVLIPPGSFLMGSPLTEAKRNKDEGPQRRVNIKYEFYMSRYEITQEEYEKVMGHNPAYFQNCPECPVEQVTWNDAKEFIQKLNANKDNYFYRLPSEAEWEYSARAGTRTIFAFGNDLSSNEANFNGDFPYGEANKGENLQKTTEVGRYKPNNWGLYDMHGNVWEFCEDVYNPSYEKLPIDGSPNLSLGDLNSRVIRGGSWFYTGSYLRSADRVKSLPNYKISNVGFRIVAITK